MNCANLVVFFSFFCKKVVSLWPILKYRYANETNNTIFIGSLSHGLSEGF
jgi:hypothetical protein